MDIHKTNKMIEARRINYLTDLKNAPIAQNSTGPAAVLNYVCRRSPVYVQ